MLWGGCTCVLLLRLFFNNLFLFLIPILFCTNSNLLFVLLECVRNGMHTSVVHFFMDMIFTQCRTLLIFL